MKQQQQKNGKALKEIGKLRNQIIFFLKKVK